MKVLILRCVVRVKWIDDSDKANGVADKLGANKRMQLSAEKRSSSDALVQWLVFFLMSWQAAFNVSHQAMYQLLMFPGRFFYVLEEVTFSPCSSVLLGSSISLFIVLDGQVSSTMCVGNVSKHVAIWKEFWRFP